MRLSAIVALLVVLLAGCASQPAAPTTPGDGLMVVPKSERKLGVEFGTFLGGSIGR